MSAYAGKAVWDDLVRSIPMVDVLDQLLRGEGWQRAKAVRTRRSGNGYITCRFVWRKRTERVAQTHEFTIKAKADI